MNLKISKVNVVEESKIIAAVKDGRGPHAIAAMLGRPTGTIRNAIDRLRRQGAIRP
jgi:DNA-directed RNA polymerase specialized sigma24 family protein